MKILSSFGYRVQKSAFECVLNKNLYMKLIDKIENFFEEGDLIRVYRLTGKADVCTWGSVGKVEHEDVIIF